MEYNRIISVTGLGGLFEMLSSKSDGAIVKSLEDKTTKFVSSRVHNFSHLESIEVYTERENVNLVDVFKAMEASSEALPSEKDPKAITAYFKKVYPEMDFERVYGSDMKKMVKWFKILKENEVEIKLPEYEEEEQEAADEPTLEELQGIVAQEAVGEPTLEELQEIVAEEATVKEEAKPKKKAAPKKKKTTEE